MIALAIGKKGSGKTAILRKLAYRASLQKRACFWLDPQGQIDTRECGRRYESVAEWRSDTHPAWLSVFRSDDLESVAALALRVGGVTLIADELDRASAGKRWTSESVKRIVHEGRHYRCGLAGGFRRTSNVSEDLLSQTDYAFLFKMSASSPSDVQTLRARFGDAYAAAAQRLEPGQFVLWADE